MTYALEARTVSVPAKAYPIITIGSETVYVDFRDVPEAVMTEIILNGALRVLRDCTAGKDESASIAAVQKRVDAWMAGSWAIVARASSQDTLMFAALQARMEKATGKTVDDKAMNKHKLDMVGKASGRVTFPEYADAFGKSKAKAKGETRSAKDIAAALIAALEPEAEAIAAERAKSLAKVDVSDIDLGI